MSCLCFLPRNDNMYLTFTSTYIGAFQKLTVVHSGEQMISSYPFGSPRSRASPCPKNRWLGFLGHSGAMTSGTTQVTFTWFLVGWFDNFVVKKMNSIWVGNMISRNRLKGLTVLSKVCFFQWLCFDVFCESHTIDQIRRKCVIYIYIWIRTFVPWVCPYRHALTVLF